jgi:hypothetical protein
MRLVFVMAAVMLAGCGGPYVRAAGPGSIVLTYWAGGEQAAMDAAQEHCAKNGGTAVLRTERVLDGYALGHRAVYECR